MLVSMIKKEISKVLIGQKEMVEVLLMGLFSGGHILLDGIPGLGKSLAVESLSQTIIGEIKFVDERLDLLGANILVVDEINRVNSKIRKALLKAMQERQIVLNGELFYLNQPLMVVATSNPGIGEKLNYPELDRFMIFYNVSYPDSKEEEEIIKTINMKQEIKLKNVISAKEILEIQRYVDELKVSEGLYKLIIKIATSTRDGSYSEIINGISPRATMYILLIARVRAFLHKRKRVNRDDVNRAAYLVLPHRLVLKENSSSTPIEITEKILGNL